MINKSTIRLIAVLVVAAMVLATAATMLSTLF